MSIDGSGPLRSRAARRRAATNRSSESMVSISRTRGAYVRTRPASLHPISWRVPVRSYACKIAVQALFSCLAKWSNPLFDRVAMSHISRQKTRPPGLVGEEFRY
jgi:hypothetical protein